MPCFFHYIAVSLSCFAALCIFSDLREDSHIDFVLSFSRSCLCVCVGEGGGGGGEGPEMTFFNFLYYVKAKEVDGLSKLCLNHFQIPSALVQNSYKLTEPRLFRCPCFRVQRHIEISSFRRPCRLQNLRQLLHRKRNIIVQLTNRKLELSSFQRYYIQIVLTYIRSYTTSFSKRVCKESARTGFL